MVGGSTSWVITHWQIDKHRKNNDVESGRCIDKCLGKIRKAPYGFFVKHETSLKVLKM